MNDLTLKRLTPENPKDWAYWPILEARVREAMPRLEPDAPPEAVIKHLRSLWATQSARLGAWLLLQSVEQTNGHVPRPLVIAHMVAWVDLYWGEPCIFIYQLEGDPGRGCLTMLDPVMRDLEAWRVSLNTMYQQAGAPQRIDLIRFSTSQPEAFTRWFRSTVPTRSGGTIVSFRMSHATVPSLEG